MTVAAVQNERPKAHDAYKHGINRITVSTDGVRYATSDIKMNVSVYENDVEILHLNASTLNQKIKPTERVRGLAFSPEGHMIYLAAGDTLSAIRVDTNHVEWAYVAPRSFGFLIISPISLDVSDKGDIVAAFDNGSVMVWDAQGKVKALWHDNDSPRSVNFVPGGERVVGTDSFSLCTWDVSKKKRKLKIGLTGRVYGMSVHRDGTRVATRTLQDVVIWDLDQKDILGVVPINQGGPVIAMHPEKDWVACGEADHVKLVDFEGNLIMEIPLNGNPCLSLSFMPGGSELLIGSTEERVLRVPVAQVV